MNGTKWVDNIAKCTVHQKHNECLPTGFDIMYVWRKKKRIKLKMREKKKSLFSNIEWIGCVCPMALKKRPTDHWRAMHIFHIIIGYSLHICKPNQTELNRTEPNNNCCHPKTLHDYYYYGSCTHYAKCVHFAYELSIQVHASNVSLTIFIHLFIFHFLLATTKKGISIIIFFLSKRKNDKIRSSYTLHTRQRKKGLKQQKKTHWKVPLLLDRTMNELQCNKIKYK